jgi:hypothetical protein
MRDILGFYRGFPGRWAARKNLKLYIAELEKALGDEAAPQHTSWPGGVQLPVMDEERDSIRAEWVRRLAWWKGAL